MKTYPYILFFLILTVLISGCAQKFSNVPYDKPGAENCGIIKDAEEKQDCALANLIKTWDLQNKFDYSDGTFEMPGDIYFYVKDKNNDEVVDGIDFEFEVNSNKAGKYNFQLTFESLEENYRPAAFSDAIAVKKGENKIRIKGDETKLDSLPYTVNVVIAEDYSQRFNKHKGHFINLTPFKFPVSQKFVPRPEEKPEPKEIIEEEEEIDPTLPDLMFEKTDFTETETGINTDLIIKNVGNDTAFNVFVEAFIDGEPLYGKANSHQKMIMKSGDSWPLALELPKADEIMLFIDDDNFVQESNESNNIYVWR